MERKKFAFIETVLMLLIIGVFISSSGNVYAFKGKGGGDTKGGDQRDILPPSVKLAQGTDSTFGDGVGTNPIGGTVQKLVDVQPVEAQTVERLDVMRDPNYRPDKYPTLPPGTYIRGVSNPNNTLLPTGRRPPAAPSENNSKEPSESEAADNYGGDLAETFHELMTGSDDTAETASARDEAKQKDLFGDGPRPGHVPHVIGSPKEGAQKVKDAGKSAMDGAAGSSDSKKKSDDGMKVHRVANEVAGVVHLS